MSLKRIQAQQAENLRLRQQLDTAREVLSRLSCLGNGDKPGNSLGNVIAREALAAIGEAQPASFDVAKAIHYPECWDTACYPTIADALREIAAFRCTNDDCEQPASAEVKSVLDELTDEQRQVLFSHYCTSCGGKELPCYCVRDD